MRPDEADIESLSQALDSTRWVLSREIANEGFKFSASDSAALPGGDIVCVETGQSVLYGDGILKLGLSDSAWKQTGNFRLLEGHDIQIGLAQIPVVPEHLEQASFELYEEMLNSVGNRSICRIWNYVPGINDTHPGLIENYKLFCSGRSKAYAASFGEETTWHFPTASATGTKSDKLTTLFIATRSPVENWENPEQTPAYLYPSAYGPCSPSFARASRIVDAMGKEWIFVSGTASIKGSDTMHQGDFCRQLDVTLENIDLVLQKCGLKLSECGSGRGRHFNAFLRNKENLPEFMDQMRKLVRQNDSLSVVEGNICRSDLEVEIELTVFTV